MVGRYVYCWEESFPVADFAVPPVLVRAVRHRDDVPSPEVQLAGLLGHKVVQRLHQHLFRHHVAQFDLLRAGHAGRPVVVDEFVQRAKLDDPEEELALRVAQHLKVLHPVRALDRQAEVAGAGLADPYQEGALVFVRQQLLGVGPRDPAVVPVVIFHLYVVARYETFLPVQLCSVPIHVVLHIQDL